MHNYQAKVIAISKFWIQDQESSLKLLDNKALGDWLSNLTSARWMQALKWLDC